MAGTMAALLVGHGRKATPSSRFVLVPAIEFLQLGAPQAVAN
jgi:hypothetical protein